MAALQVGDDALEAGGIDVQPPLGRPVADAHPVFLPAAVEEIVPLGGRQVADRYIQGDVLLLAGGFQQLPVVAVARPVAAPGFDGPLPQRFAPVGDDQGRFDLQLGAQAGAGRASAVGTVEGKGARLDFGQVDAAMHTGEML